MFGGANTGAHAGYFLNFRVAGFKNGGTLLSIDSWGMVFQNCSFVANTVGWCDSVGAENTSFYGGRFTANGTHFSITAGDYYLIGTSLDQHVTVGIRATAGILQFTNCHWENSASLPANFVDASGTSTFLIKGGDLLDDQTSGTTAFYFRSNGYAIDIDGLSIQSMGRRVTSVLACNRNCRGFIRVLSQSSSLVTNIVGGTGSANVTNLSYSVLSSNAALPINFEGPVTTPTVTLTAAAPTTAAGQVSFGGTTAATATAGGGQVAPDTVAGYLIVNVAGTARKIPYFAA
jgi:hypothetical protein